MNKIHFEAVVPWALSSMFGTWCHTKTTWFNRTSEIKQATCKFCKNRIKEYFKESKKGKYVRIKR